MVQKRHTGLVAGDLLQPPLIEAKLAAPPLRVGMLPRPLIARAALDRAREARTIYRKLGVNSRADAIARAEVLRLLEPTEITDRRARLAARLATSELT
jgi:hypothetical protein